MALGRWLGENPERRLRPQGLHSSRTVGYVFQAFGMVSSAWAKGATTLAGTLRGSPGMRSRSLSSSHSAVQETIMHTDEYEISIMNFEPPPPCGQEDPRRPRSASARPAWTMPPPRQAVAAGRLLLSPSELAAWREDVEALPSGSSASKYRQALEMMRISASRG